MSKNKDRKQKGLRKGATPFTGHHPVIRSSEEYERILHGTVCNVIKGLKSRGMISD